MGGPSGSELGMFGQGVLSLEYPKHDLEGGMQTPVGHILLALWTPLCRKGLSRAGPEWALQGSALAMGFLCWAEGLTGQAHISCPASLYKPHAAPKSNICIVFPQTHLQ